MRRLGLLVLVVGACSADIAPEAYFCGPEQLCPEGLTCDAVTDLCSVPSSARPFDCEFPDRENDDAPAAAFALQPALECVSGVRELRACLFADDPGDWFQFEIPANCSSVQIEARLTFPLAHEPVLLQLSTEGGAPETVDTDCKVSTGNDNGSESRCFERTVANGSRHAIGLVHSGTDNCGGECAFNRYLLNLQLSTP